LGDCAGLHAAVVAGRKVAADSTKDGGVLGGLVDFPH
jgi:hypothetical protein